ncbi:ribonuclease D [Fodinicurvata sp. EGI_FJ10296]|uniref:ribonuclease D n=1 Tax=Fodinicurvata sp. EGI_FJ10296 TaxID=3231908 RepID=UPI0034571166
MTLITDQKSLDAFCSAMTREPYVTVDTEFLRESTYWPKLCLVQIAGADQAAAIDPLADGIDLAPVLDLLADPNVLKVFHSARQDIEIFVQLTGTVPAPVFDTQIAAMVCGFGESIGFEALVTRLTDHRVDKSSRFTDWSLRPLSEKQLAYALADVTLLRPAYEALRDDLARNGREAWLSEEVQTLTDKETYVTRPEDAWRRIKTRSTDRKALSVLKHVAAWREREAQARDLPRGRVLRDEPLVDIAMRTPKTVEELAKTRGIAPTMARGKQGTAILAAIADGLAVPADQRPKVAGRPPVADNGGGVLEMLKVLLKMTCEQHKVAQKLVANSADLERIVAEDNPDVPALSGWRREIFGQQALDLKAGRLALSVNGGTVRVHDLSKMDALSTGGD